MVSYDPLLDGVLTKECNVCKKVKALTEYSPNKTCKHGVVGTCRPCANSRVSSWYSNNRRRRQETANSNNQYRKKRVVQHFGDKCHDCGQTFHQCVYQFHHLNPSEKEYNPSKVLSMREERMWVEINKCVMLCANCHMIRHYASQRKEAINDNTAY